MIFRVGELFQSNLIPGMIKLCWKEYKMDLGGHMVPRAEWATFGVPRVWGGWGGGDNLNHKRVKNQDVENNSKLQSNKS